MHPFPFDAPCLTRPVVGRARRAVAGGVLVAAVVLTGCAGDDADEAVRPTTPATVPGESDAPRPTTAPPTAPLPDTRGVELVPVTGPAPTTTIDLEIEGGEATLSGSLGYLGEPVQGATVRLERWVDGQSNAVELTTGAGGGWIAEGIQGGRYVIRAWKGDSLTLEFASAVFIAEDEDREIHLAMVSVLPPPDEGDDEDEDSDEDEDDEKDDEDSDDDDTTTTTEDEG